MMLSPTVKLILGPGAKLPEYAHDTDAGADLFSAEDVYIYAGTTAMVHTGLTIELPDGYEAQVRSKSGLAGKSGVFVLNSPGTIDQGYRGPIEVILYNCSHANFHVEKGTKIAQLVIAPYIQGHFYAVGLLSTTERGAAGFGSTDVRGEAQSGDH